MAMQGTVTALLCGFVLPTMDLQSSPPSPRQQDTFPSGHQGSEDINHTGHPLL